MSKTVKIIRTELNSALNSLTELQRFSKEDSAAYDTCRQVKRHIGEAMARLDYETAQLPSSKVNEAVRKVNTLLQDVTAYETKSGNPALADARYELNRLIAEGEPKTKSEAMREIAGTFGIPFIDVPLAKDDPNAEQNYYLSWAHNYKRYTGLDQHRISAQYLANMLAEFVARHNAKHKAAAPLHTQIDPTKDPKAWNEALALTMNPRTQDRQDLHDFRVAIAGGRAGRSVSRPPPEGVVVHTDPKKFAEIVEELAQAVFKKAKEADRES